MDSPSTSLDQNLDLSKLTPKDKQELQQFIVNESQKARIQQCMSASSVLLNFKGVYAGALLMLYDYSYSQPNGYLLEEMRDRHSAQRQVGEGRGVVCAELCGSVFGCEFHGY